MFLFLGSLSRRHSGAESGARLAKCARHLVILVLFASLLVLGCGEPQPGLVSLDGRWVSEFGEVFIIDLTKMKYNNPADGEWGDYSIAGDIQEIVKFGNDGSSGIIYIKITSKGINFATDNVGDFTGIHFKYLDNTTVEFSTAANVTDYKTPVYSTLAAAKAALNENSLGNYFASGSACKKQ